MRVLVTGLRGFTGLYAGRDLEAAGHTVIGLHGDIRDRAAIAQQIADARPDAVLHLAGQAFVSHDDHADFYSVNTIGTVELLEALLAYGREFKAVLLSSSASIYGNVAEGSIDETRPPDPANHYAVSKLAMEHAARLYGRELPITILRPFNYTGVGQKPSFLVPKIVGHFRDRAPVIELGNLDVEREFGDVRRVAAIYRQLVETPRPGVTVNVCTGRTHALRDIIGICERLTGHRLEVRVNPAFVRKNEVKRMAGDPTLLSSLVDAEAPIPLEETLRWMLDAPDSPED